MNPEVIFLLNKKGNFYLSFRGVEREIITIEDVVHNLTLYAESSRKFGVIPSQELKNSLPVFLKRLIIFLARKDNLSFVVGDDFLQIEENQIEVKGETLIVIRGEKKISLQSGAIMSLLTNEKNLTIFFKRFFFSRLD